MSHSVHPLPGHFEARSWQDLVLGETRTQLDYTVYTVLSTFYDPTLLIIEQFELRRRCRQCRVVDAWTHRLEKKWRICPCRHF